MADELQFIEDGLQRSQIDEFFADELGRAGYGGMDVAHTPMGTQIVLKAEKPGMVIGKGGKNIRKITTELEDRFDLDDPQIDVQEVDEPDLNARIVADRLANALERGWYFRKAGHTTIDRIVDAGALGAEIVLSGKVTGARSRVEKFSRGYIKHNGEPAEEIVDEGQGVAVMKLGTIGVTVKIIPPGADLPDDFRVAEEANVEELVVDEADEGVEDLLEGTEEVDADEGAADFEEVETPADEDEFEEPEFDEEEVIEDSEARSASDSASGDEPRAEPDEAARTPTEAADEDEPPEDVPDQEDDEAGADEAEASGPDEDLDEETEAEAEALLEEMEGDEDEEVSESDDSEARQTESDGGEE